MRLGVVGAGVIGRGVAHTFARAGIPVRLVDISPEALEDARRQIKRDIRLARIQGLELGDSAGVLDSIQLSTDLADLSDVDFVVENVWEDESVKKDVYRALNDVCAPYVPFAANTSAIPVTRIGHVSGRPEMVVGIHFMNPVPVKSTVEVIRGVHTSQGTVDAATQLLAAAGKNWVVVKDSPGFVSNRILMLAVNEAAFLVHEGVATAEQVDAVLTQCFDHRMGMLETADLIGLDTVLRSIDILYAEFRDAKYRACPLLQQMVDAGLLGRKSGQGFYKYDSR